MNKKIIKKKNLLVILSNSVMWLFFFIIILNLNILKHFYINYSTAVNIRFLTHKNCNTVLHSKISTWNKNLTKEPASLSITGVCSGVTVSLVGLFPGDIRDMKMFYSCEKTYAAYMLSGIKISLHCWIKKDLPVCPCI